MPSLRSILILALLLRLALPAAAYIVRGDTAVFIYNDSPHYLRLATSLAHDGQYRGDHGPELYRPPGYPLFLAVALLTPSPYLLIIGLQALLGVFTVYMVWRTAILLMSPSGAFAAALMAAVDPLLVFWTTKVMSETLFTALLAVFVFVCVRYLKDPGTRWLVAAALAVSAAAYVRAIAYVLPIWAVGLLLIWSGRRGWTRRLAPQLLLFLAISATLLGAWNLRNGRATGYYTFSTLGDRALYFAGGAAIEAKREGRTFYETRDRFLEDYKSRYQRGQDEDVSGYRTLRREGIALIASAPLTYARFWIAGMLRTVFDPGAVEYLRLFGQYPAFGGLLGRIVDAGLVPALLDLPAREPLLFWTTLVLAVVLVPYLLLPLLAPFTAPADARPAVFLLIGFVVFFLILSGGAYGASRFRHPIEPTMAILAAIGLQATGFGTERRQNRRTSRTSIDSLAP